MGRRILLIQGHPDATRAHLCHALADAYAEGAREAGHEVRTVDVGRLDVPVLRSAEDWEHGTLPAPLAEAQAAVEWAEHLVVLFPLWLGDMPALLKAFLEQIFRPGFAFERDARNPFSAKRLGGRSARVVVTMGMPALIYRWVFRAHALKSLERNIFGFVGIRPVRETLLGGIGTLDEAAVAAMRSRLGKLGRAGG